MRQIVIRESDAGQRLDKFLHKYMKEAPTSFFYKMLRKKNITLNKKKADGSEKIKDGDLLELFLAEDTIEKFKGQVSGAGEVLPACLQDGKAAFRALQDVPVIFENDHVLIVNKPAGILSQKSEPGDLSLNEWIIGYLYHNKTLTSESLSMFRPSVCNRLDRNTSGLVICSKSLYGSQEMSRIIKERLVKKYYRLLVNGKMELAENLDAWLLKNEKNNTVTVLDKETPKSSHIVTGIYPLAWIPSEKMTYVEVELITGKTHQIRAHLSSIGHPIAGDYKYGRKAENEQLRIRFGIRSQLLHAYRLVFPQMPERLQDMSYLKLLAPLPDSFEKLMETKTWLPGIQED